MLVPFQDVAPLDACKGSRMFERLTPRRIMHTGAGHSGDGRRAVVVCMGER